MSDYLVEKFAEFVGKHCLLPYRSSFNGLFRVISKQPDDFQISTPWVSFDFGRAMQAAKDAVCTARDPVFVTLVDNYGDPCFFGIRTPCGWAYATYCIYDDDYDAAWWIEAESLNRRKSTPSICDALHRIVHYATGKAPTEAIL